LKKKSIDYILTAIEEIRKLSKELVVPKLKGNSLVDTIKQMIDDINLSGKLHIRFTHDQENDLMSAGKKVTIFRILQEQMKNILKYSGASQVDVILRCRDRNAELMITDNGIGFDPQKTRKGVGLSSIYERTRFYNGKMDIDSEPGKGCKLVISIPCYD
jgi:signal transduction histidine kinase